MNADVQIAGMGVVSALGRGLEATLHGFAAEAVNAGPARTGFTDLSSPVFAVAGVAGPMRTVELCRLAAQEALAHSGFHGAELLARTGVCLGTTVACQLNDVEFYASCRSDAASLSMEPVSRYLHGNLAEALAAEIGAGGPVCTVVNACSSGADAIGMALQWIRAGLCDRALAGGADELNLVPLCGFRSLGIMSQQCCRPFDRDRDGLNLGEGAGILALESVRAARQREAHPADLFLLGYGASGDAHHLTAPRPDGSGLEAAIRVALDDARLEPEHMAFVNAHGTATPDNDRVEGSVLSRMFGPRTPVLSTKGYTGHTLGAAGGIEAVFAALSLREGWIPPSAGFQNPDPEIALAPITRRSLVAGRAALSTSLAFGGNNAALVVGLGKDFVRP